MRDAVPVESLGDLREGVLGELGPDPADDLRFLWHEYQLARVGQPAARIASTRVTQRVVTPMSAILEQPALDARHPLRVEIPLELGGERQLAEHVASVGPVEVRAGHVGHEEWHPATLQLRREVEHQPGVPGKA